MSIWTTTRACAIAPRSSPRSCRYLQLAVDGRAVAPLLRNRGHGDDNRLTIRFAQHPTRRLLLDMFPATPTVDDILDSHDPGRAKSYWRDAITLLKHAGVIAYYRELGAVTPKRQGWARVALANRTEGWIEIGSIAPVEPR